MSGIIPIQIIENKIFVIRGHKVMLDSDLAVLYDVETKALNRAVKRNLERFPNDFMFQLTNEEWENLRCQIGTSKTEYGGRRYSPYVFTEHGVLMLSNLLNSKKAVAVSIQIMRTFVKLREIALINKDTAQRLDELEKTVITLAKDTQTDIQDIFRQLRNLAEITKPSQTGQIGFKSDN